MNQKVIDLLNAARARELAAVQQYMAHHYGSRGQRVWETGKENQGYSHHRNETRGEARREDSFLNGVPEYKPDGMPKKGEEIAGVPHYGQGDRGRGSYVVQ